MQGGCVSGLPGTVHLNTTLLRRHVKYIASSKRCIAFFFQHLLMHKICLTLETESSTRKKTHCMAFALEGAGKASNQAIKDGHQQAKATDANEVPLWNHFTVFRNYNKRDDFSLEAKIRYHKRYPAMTATQSLKKIQEPQQQLGH